MRAKRLAIPQERYATLATVTPTAAPASTAAPAQEATLRVLAFGVAREIAGAGHIDLPATGGPATVAELHRHLTARYPALAGIGAVRYAVNQRLADDNHPIGPGDELAIIPPVSGG